MHNCTMHVARNFKGCANRCPRFGSVGIGTEPSNPEPGTHVPHDPSRTQNPETRNQTQGRTWSPEPRQNPEPRTQTADPRTQMQGSVCYIPDSRPQFPQSRFPIQFPRSQIPDAGTQSLVARCQSPQFRLQIPDSGFQMQFATLQIRWSRSGCRKVSQVPQKDSPF